MTPHLSRIADPEKGISWTGTTTKHPASEVSFLLRLVHSMFMLFLLSDGKEESGLVGLQDQVQCAGLLVGVPRSNVGWWKTSDLGKVLFSRVLFK